MLDKFLIKAEGDTFEVYERGLGLLARRGMGLKRVRVAGKRSVGGGEKKCGRREREVNDKCDPCRK